MTSQKRVTPALRQSCLELHLGLEVKRLLEFLSWRVWILGIEDVIKKCNMTNVCSGIEWFGPLVNVCSAF